MSADEKEKMRHMYHSGVGYRRHYTANPCQQCGRSDYTATRGGQKFCCKQCWERYDAVHGVRSRKAACGARGEAFLDLRTETEGECLRLAGAAGGACEFASCRHHCGTAGKCAVLLASLGQQTNVEIAALLGVTKQRVHVIELAAEKKLRRNPVAKRCFGELLT
jgi:hypothetical protein